MMLRFQFLITRFTDWSDQTQKLVFRKFAEIFTSLPRLVLSKDFYEYHLTVFNCDESQYIVSYILASKCCIATDD
jgi:hypothetical protein